MRLIQRNSYAYLLDRLTEPRPSDPKECMLWDRRKNNRGYGTLIVPGMLPLGPKLVHRMAYEAIHGELESSELVLHHCDTPLCFRPEHLFIGTHQDNIDDMWAKNRQQTYTRGPDAFNALLTHEKVRAIRKLYAEGNTTLRKLAEQFGIKNQSIHKVIKRQTYKHVD